MQVPKLSSNIIRIVGVSLLIVAVAVAVKTGFLQDISRQIRAAVWRPETPWSLEIQQTFSECGHRLRLENTYRSETAVRGYLQRHPECRLIQQESHRLVGAVNLAGFCPTCHDQQFLGIRDQAVVIIRGTPRQPGPVKEKTSIQLKLLPEAERSDLARGIPFRDEREKLQIIEGLNGLIAN